MKSRLVIFIIIVFFLLAFSTNIRIVDASEDEASLTEEIAYEDGVPESGRSHINVGVQLAVKFSLSPGLTEAKLSAAKYYIALHPASFKVHIYDSDGFTDLITPIEVTPTGIGWFDVNLSQLDLTLNENFYITIELMESSKPFIGLDETKPHAGRSFQGEPDNWKAISNGDLLIRAVVKPIYYGGDIVLNGNNVATIEGKMDLNGSVVIEENATLILRRAFLNFTQDRYYHYNITLRKPLNGKPRLLIYDSTVTSNFGMPIKSYYNSTVTISNSTITINVVAHDNSRLSISDSYVYREISNDENIVNIHNSTIYMLEGYYSAEAQIYDSEIRRMIVGSKSVECAISGLEPESISHWSFIDDCFVNILPEGWAPNITLTNTSVSGWLLFFYGISNASISDSIIDLAMFDSSMVRTVDSTLKSPHLSRSSALLMVNSTLLELPSIRDRAKIQVAWYLDAHVVDSIGQDIPSATVKALYPNGTLAGLELTDSDGLARLILIEKILNATGEYPIGSYTIEAKYDLHICLETTDVMGNQQITLTLEDFVIPEFSSTSIFLLLMMLTTIIYLKRETEKRKILNLKSLKFKSFRS